MGPAAEIAALLACWALLLAPGAPHRPAERGYTLGALEEYRLVIPTSTDSEGRFLSKVVSGAPKGRFRRDTLGDLPHGVANEQIFYNVTVFGREFHFRLRPNSRLVAPGATVEWQVDSNITYIEPLHGNCLYIGDITDLPNASVAISNCDGLGSSAFNRSPAHKHLAGEAFDILCLQQLLKIARGKVEMPFLYLRTTLFSPQQDIKQNLQLMGLIISMLTESSINVL
ncbi:UNVERIFIED_CONTAM: hypothetical protein K2H54_035618 [Gekko kuhli]